MTDRPIIFSAPMVRALLAGKKTMTRRLAWKPLVIAIKTEGRPVDEVRDPSPWQRVQAGDRLWVRESIWEVCPGDGPQVAEPGNSDGRKGAFYRVEHPCHPPCPHFTSRPSIHMPRWASRLTLTVTAVRVERLHEISEEDAMAEGAEPVLVPPDGGSSPHKEGFRDLWNSLHGPDAWAANPEVVALTFTVERRNIDAR